MFGMRSLIGPSSVLQVLYERSCDYLELETRVEVLNARFQVLQEMLDMLRDHQQVCGCKHMVVSKHLLNPL